jgi:hypothetical protein
MKRATLILVALAMTILPSSTRAGTIISTNLPTGSVIVNINGQQDGAAGYGGQTPPGVIGVNQDDWYQPFNTNHSLLEYTFQPGAYSFRIINPTDAKQLFPSLTTSQLSQIGGAWSYNSPWATDWMAFDSSAATNPTEHQLFTGAVTPDKAPPGAQGFLPGAGYSTQDEAYQAAKLGGYFDQIVTGTGRYTGTTQASYTFTTTETLIFDIPDYYLPDNQGVVSVLISPTNTSATPEPSTLALLGMASASFAGYFGWRRIKGRVDGSSASIRRLQVSRPAP